MSVFLEVTPPLPIQQCGAGQTPERERERKKPHQKKLHKRGRKGPFLFPLRCFLIQTHNNSRWSLLLCCDVAGEEGKGALYAACVWSLFFLSLFIFRGQKKKRNLSPRTRERYDIHQLLPKLNYESLPKFTGIALRRLMNLFVSDFVESFLPPSSVPLLPPSSSDALT